LAQERLARVLANLPDMVVELDRTGRVRFVSAANGRISGYPAERVRGTSPLERIHPEDRAQVADHLDAVLRGGPPLVFEYRYLHAAGHVIWLETRSLPLWTGDGRPDGALLISRDVTDRRRIAVALDHRDALFRGLVENSHDIILVHNSLGGIVYVSPSVTPVLGYTPEEMIGLEPGPIQVQFPGEGEDTHYAISVAHRTLGVHRLEAVSRWIVIDGRRDLVLTTLRDVTARHAADEAGRRQREFALALVGLSATMSSSLDLVRVLDRVLEFAHLVVPCTASSIMFAHDKRAEIVHSRGFTERGVDTDLIDIHITGHSKVVQAMHERRALMIRDAHDDPSWQRSDRTEFVRSCLFVPIIAKGDLIGLLNAYSDRVDQFGLEDIERLQAFADQAAIALDNARLFAQTQTERRRLELLYRLQHDLDVSRGVADVACRAARYGVHDLQAIEAQVWWVNPVGTQLHAYRPNHDDSRVIGRLSEWSWLLEHHSPAVLEPDDPRSAGLAATAPELFAPGATVLLIPLWSGPELLGLMLLARDQQVATEDLAVYQSIGQTLSITLQSAHLLEDRLKLLESDQQRADELAALYRISGSLLTASDHHQLAEQITRAVQKEILCQRCSVSLIDAHARTISRLTASRPELVRDHALPLEGPGLVPTAVRERRVIYVPDTLRNERAQGHDPATRSMLVIPLRNGPDVLGVLVLEGDAPDSFSARDRRIMTAFAERAGLAIQTATLFAHQAHYARSVSVINHIAQTGLAAPDLRTMLDTMADHMAELIGADGATISLWEENGQRRRQGGASRQVRALYHNLVLEPDEKTLGRAVVQARSVIIVPDTHDTDLISPRVRAAFNGRSLVSAPIMLGERVLGSVTVAFKRRHEFTPAEISDVQNAANVVALGLANQQLFHELARARHEAERASQLKSDFLANTSHELRTPLTGILGALRLVLEDVVETPEEKHAFVQTAHDAALRLLSTINELLDLSKIEAGQLDVDAQPVDIDLIVRQVKTLLAPQADQQGLDLCVENELPAGIHAWADPDHVRHILLNLVGNAIKFTPTGSVSIVCRPAGPATLEVAVVDTGIGIAADVQQRLFQPFVQGDSSSTRRYGGTGLGLAISRRLAETMHGQLSLHSAGEGAGSTFTLCLPIWNGQTTGATQSE
jgi:PAS domain S-box-containing protein